jgi:hypothetical protein
MIRHGSPFAAKKYGFMEKRFCSRISDELASENDYRLLILEANVSPVTLLSPSHKKRFVLFISPVEIRLWGV